MILRENRRFWKELEKSRNFSKNVLIYGQRMIFIKNWTNYKSGVPKVTKNGQPEPVPKLTMRRKNKNE